MDTEPKDEISKELREEINKSLDEYEKQLKLPQFSSEIEAPKYLTMNLEDLRKKSPEELAEASYLLAQYGFFIARSINRLRVWKRWGEGKLDAATAFNFEKIPNTGWSERVLIARNGSDYCKRLNDFLFHVGSRLDRLYNIPEFIKQINDSLRDIRFIALRREKEE